MPQKKVQSTTKKADESIITLETVAPVENIKGDDKEYTKPSISTSKVNQPAYAYNAVVEDEDTLNDEVQQVEDRLNESGVLNAALIAEVKKLVTAEILSDLKEENVLKEKETDIRREMEDIEYNNYVALKMDSDDPWVDFVGEVRDTTKGQRLEMNWNAAFIVFLKSIGVTGADEEQMVQKYISLLLRDMVDQNEKRYGSDFQ